MILTVAAAAPVWGYVVAVVVGGVVGAYCYKWFANKFDAAVKAATSTK